MVFAVTFDVPSSCSWVAVCSAFLSIRRESCWGVPPEVAVENPRWPEPDEPDRTTPEACIHSPEALVGAAGLASSTGMEMDGSNSDKDRHHDTSPSRLQDDRDKLAVVPVMDVASAADAPSPGEDRTHSPSRPENSDEPKVCTLHACACSLLRGLAGLFGTSLIRRGMCMN